MTSISVPTSTSTSVRTSITAVLSATAAAVAIWSVATAAGVDFTVGVGSNPPTQITVVNVALGAFMGSLAGWGLLALLRRFTPKARTIWTVSAVTFAFLSLAAPLSAVASSGTKVSLAAIHLTVASVLIVLLRRTGE